MGGTRVITDIQRYIKPRYTFDEIIEYQKLPLEVKEEISVEVIRQAAGLSKHNISLAFSGGKDSQVVSDLIERFCPDIHNRLYCIFGNTGVEFPESLRFARKYGVEHYGERFKETKPVTLQNDELRYEFAKKIVAQLEEEGALDEIMRPDGVGRGGIKSQKALIVAAQKRGYPIDHTNCYFKGTPMTFAYCLEQYGLPLLGKSASKRDTHRINVECFLKYSAKGASFENEEDEKYYEILRQCKFSQHCCKILKKEPSERLEADLGVDMVFKGLMASESRARMTNLSVRGHIFASTRPHITDGPFYHVSPIGFWTDDDVWDYIHKYNLEYSPFYDIKYEASDGTTKCMKRNGCMFCGTDIQFKDNHLATLRQTYPRAWKVAMEKFGYREALNTLFKFKKNQGILEAMSETGSAARMIDSVGDNELILEARPCVYDDFGEMVDVSGTGLENEYDPEFSA